MRTRIVIVGSCAYAGLIALVTWQALRGQPLLSPDLWTTADGVRAALAPGRMPHVTALPVRAHAKSS